MAGGVVTTRSDVVDAVERLSFSLVAVTTAAIAAGGRGLEPTFRQWRLLVILGDGPTGHRLGEIVERIGGSAPSASRLVRRMQARGLVTIVPDPIDGRGIRVSLTGEGAALRSAIIAARRDLLAAGLERLYASASLAAALDEVARALEAWR